MVNKQSLEDRTLPGRLLLLFSLLYSSPAMASNMSGGGYAIVAALLFGFVLGLIVQLVFSILLHLRIGRQGTQQRRGLPVIAMVVSAVLVAGCLGALALGGGISSIWTEAGWGLLLGWSLSNLFWAIISLARTTWSPASLWAIRLVPILVSLLLPASFILPSMAQGLYVRTANEHAHRLVEKTLSGHFLGVNDLTYALDSRRVISVSEKDKHPWPAIWLVSSGKQSRSPSCTETEPPVAPALRFVDGGLAWVQGRYRFNHGRLLFQGTAPDSQKKDLGVEHAGPLDSTPDGRSMVIGSGLYTGKLTVLRFPGGRTIRRWDLPSNAREVAISHDGRFVAHDSARQEAVYIRRVADGAVVLTLNKTSSVGRIASMALSSSGDHLALGGEDGTLEVWDRSGRASQRPALVQASRTDRKRVQVLFLSDSQLLATGAAGFVMARWSVGSWNLGLGLKRWPGEAKEECSAPHAVAELTNADPGRLIVGCRGYAKVISSKTGSTVRTYVGLEGEIEAVSHSSQSGLVAAGGRFQPRVLFSGKSGARLAGQHASSLVGRAFSISRSRTAGVVAVGMSNGKIALFEGKEFSLQAVLFSPPDRVPGEVRILAFSADGQQLVSADTSGSIRLWSTRRRVPLGMGIALKDTAVAAAPLRGNRFLLLFRSGDLRRWSTGEQGLSAEKRYRSGCKHARALAVAEMSNLVAVGCGDGKIRLFALETMALHRTTAELHKLGVTALAFSADGARLLSGGYDGRVLSWSLPGLGDRREIYSSRRKDDGEVPILKEITRISYSPDSQQLAVATDGNMDNIHIISSASLASSN